MAGEFLAGLSAFKAMLDITKGLMDINDVAARNAAVIELQKEILSAQMQQTTLIERVGDLEKEVARFETWETEKQRYKLHKLTGGAFVYMLKKTEAHGEPGHTICATCYQRGVKSILQDNGSPYIDKNALVCPNCRTEIKTGGHPTPEYADE